eukprot:4150913-Lingulodinium_polyedra.AAC.1
MRPPESEPAKSQGSQDCTEAEPAKPRDRLEVLPPLDITVDEMKVLKSELKRARREYNSNAI